MLLRQIQNSRRTLIELQATSKDCNNRGRRETKPSINNQASSIDSSTRAKGVHEVFLLA
jgi:hypothetical protein